MGLFSLMRAHWHFVDATFFFFLQQNELFTPLIKHACIVCGSLQMFVLLVIATLVFSHTISLGDCSLFSKENLNVSLTHATKFL